jgi:hypothetical protein
MMTWLERTSNRPNGKERFCLAENVWIAMSYPRSLSHSLCPRLDERAGLDLDSERSCWGLASRVDLGRAIALVAYSKSRILTYGHLHRGLEIIGASWGV